MLICHVVGARPNFVKVAPVIEALNGRGVKQLLVHTGQHYDRTMSDVFFDELGMPEPDVHLDVGSDTHARQTAKIMLGFDEVCERHRPDVVLVAGDVNSTMACALTAAKRNIPVAHLEAGLRSFDRTMPEEINRVVTDHVSDLLFTTQAGAEANLRAEGIAAEKIHFVGNCMVDTLLKQRAAAVAREPWAAYALTPEGYALVTLHRPSNVDQADTLRRIIGSLAEIAATLPVLFAVHPRTRERMRELAAGTIAGIRFCEPLPYLTFLGLVARARVVLTDSGGIQEETTALGIPCLTLRHNTERPVTITDGTNRLVGNARETILEGFRAVMRGDATGARVPPLWDGAAARRTADVLVAWAATRGA